MTAFSSLHLSDAMLENLKALEYTVMTEIQEASIPTILAGNDLLAQAKTGSGKTAAFGIGLLENLDASLYRVQALILCPTRELAVQVTEELRRIARFKDNLKIVSLTGGATRSRQELSLKHEPHVVVGTPGRVLKLLQRGSLALDDIKAIVLDEADRMLDLGFIEQVREIFGFAPTERQTLYFSATFPREVRELSRSFLKDPREIATETQHDTTVIAQHFYRVRPADKTHTTVELLTKHRPSSTLIFCNTKATCRTVRDALNAAGTHCLALHGDLEQKERTEVLVRFSNESCTVLVATDVAARGIDIEELGAVINYDLPFKAETYVHRIGRTGRAGHTGTAFSLMAPGEEFRIEEINEAMGTSFSATAAELGSGKQRPALEPPMVTLSINGGRKDKISPGDLLGALTAKGGIAGADVGKIDRMETLTFVAIKRAAAGRALKLLQSAPIKGRRFIARLND